MSNSFATRVIMGSSSRQRSVAALTPGPVFASPEFLEAVRFDISEAVGTDFLAGRDWSVMRWPEGPAWQPVPKHSKPARMIDGSVIARFMVLIVRSRRAESQVQAIICGVIQCRTHP